MKINGNLLFFPSTTDSERGELKNAIIERVDMGGTPATYDASSLGADSTGNAPGRILYDTNTNAYWYYDPTQNGGEWSRFGDSDNINNILQFIGAGLGDTAPTYASSTIVGAGANLETAVSNLDAYLTQMVLDDLTDVTDPQHNGTATVTTTGTSYMLQGNGTSDGYDLIAFPSALPSDMLEAVQDAVGALIIGGSDLTATYDDGANTLTLDVDDSFLRNTGDSLGDGVTPAVLTIQANSQITIANGADLVIADVPVNPTDAVNKSYVDTVATGLDPKESVRVATTGDVAGTYAPAGGTEGSGNFTGMSNTVDGVTLVDGDRVLVKDQTDPKQNGIYVVVTAGTGSDGVWERAPDQDGNPASEVSGGNHTFVEAGATQSDTGWVVVADGNVALNTDDVVWSQFSGAGNFTAGSGLDQFGTEVFLDVQDLTSATIVGADFIPFFDTSATTTNTDGGTRGTTVDDFLADLNILSSQPTAAGQVMVSDGVNGDYAQQRIQYVYDSAAPALTHTVNHGLNQQWCTVVVVEGSDVIIPESITYTDANTIDVGFDTAIDCKVIVMGVPGVGLNGA